MSPLHLGKILDVASVLRPLRGLMFIDEFIAMNGHQGRLWS